MPDTPLVSVAIPLYKSKKFVRIILSNIKRIKSSEVEIILSDRHGEDDTIDVLKKELENDSRIRFIQAADRIGWVDHYNQLLKDAHGRYFMWMPHDDSFPTGYVEELVRDLEEHPDAWLSFGNIYTINKNTRNKQLMYLPDTLNANDRPWLPWYGVRFVSVYNPGIAFRGMFRRDRVLAGNLLIRHSCPDDQYADLYWLFALGLHGKIYYNARQLCVKRYYESSTHYRWDNRNYISRKGYQLMKVYIDTAAVSISHKRKLTFAVWIVYLSKKMLRLVPGRIKGFLKNLTGLVPFSRPARLTEVS